jgi:hypothetical protein
MTKLKNMMLAVAGGLILSASLTAGAQVYVRNGPPPPRANEVVPRSPHRGWVWQPGYYRWDGRRYNWYPGLWARPPYGGARWVSGYWRRGPGGYLWVDGRWSR